MALPFSSIKNVLSAVIYLALGLHSLRAWPVGVSVWLFWSFVAYVHLSWVSIAIERRGASLGKWLRPGFRSRHEIFALVVLFPYRVAVRVVAPLSVLLFREQVVTPVIPQVYLGGRLLFFQERFFRQYPIRAVLNVCGEVAESPFIRRDPQIELREIPLLDNTAPTHTEFEETLKWMEGLLDQNKSIYIHCAYGHGRSVIFVIALLLRKKCFSSVDEAEAYLQSIRAGVHLKPLQRQFLKAVGPI